LSTSWASISDRPGYRIKVVVSCFVVLAFAGSTLADDKKPASAKGTAGGSTFVTTDDLKWIEMPNSPPGVKTAILWGDPAK